MLPDSRTNQHIKIKLVEDHGGHEAVALDGSFRATKWQMGPLDASGRGNEVHRCGYGLPKAVPGLYQTCVT
jgi:hypothetical protein